MQAEKHPFADFEVIHRYTRAEAIADGVLVDISKLAREAGFNVPVAITSAAQGKAITMEQGAPSGQSETGRTWDMLNVLRHSCRTSRASGPRLSFTFLVARTEAHPRRATEIERVTLHCHSGPGDDGEHVLTIMLPSED